MGRSDGILSALPAQHNTSAFHENSVRRAGEDCQPVISGSPAPQQVAPPPTECLHSPLMLRAGVVRETAPGETRVAVVPDAAAKLAQAKLEVLVEAGAGLAASHSDEAYREAHPQE